MVSNSKIELKPNIEANSKIEVSVTEPTSENSKIDKLSSSNSESRTRSCVKAIGWRGIALGTTMSISYFYLGDISTATKIGVVDMGIKFMVHFMYERIWSHIKWGYN